MIRVFSENNIPKASVIELWQECFGDTKEYVEFFLNNCPQYTCITYYADSDKPVAMLFLLDGFLNNRKCKYLYAACTSVNYRRQGIMERLIEYSKKYAFDDGAAGIFLVPANENLYSYYSKFGFIPSFKKKETLVSVETESNYFTCELSLNEIIDLRRELCSKIDSFIFEDKIIEYSIKEHLFNGGFVIGDKLTNTILFCYEDQDKIVIKEYLSESFSIDDLINNRFINNKGKNIYISSPIVYNSTDKVENYTKCGMCFPLDNEMKTFLECNKEIYAGMYLD